MTTTSPSPPLQAELDEYLLAHDDVDDVDTKDLAQQLAMRAESHFGM
ncbi:hypothetical protein ACFXBB_35640 [Streptomyces scopuliridis]